MEITIKQLEVENFKSHSKFSSALGGLTNIYGRNGAGKSSIGDTVTWLLFGTDQLGTKLDPKPLNDTEAEIKVSATLIIDGKEVTLSKTQAKTAKYFIDEVPEKATAFNEYVTEWFDKDLFLSLFNPIYFFTQNWKDQRAMVLRYVDEPLNAEVFVEMPNVQSKQLEEGLKKYSLTDLEKVHKERFKTKDTAFTRASERLLTLQEQLEKAEQGGNVMVDTSALEERMKALVAERDALDESRHAAQSIARKRNKLTADLQFLGERMMRQKDLIMKMKQEKIDSNCSTCGQTLDEDAVDQVKKNFQDCITAAIEEGKQMSANFQELKQTLSELPPVEEDDTLHKSRELDEEVMKLKYDLDTSRRLSQLKEDLTLVEENKKAVLKERNDSQSILDSIKSFRTKQAEVMVKKVDNLFTTISVRLFEMQKNGEMKDTFEIEMDGKPYSKLSTAEKIKCGLEMIEALSQQSGIIAPTFIDNAESILKYTAPAGQLITAKVKAGELKVEVKEEIKGAAE